MLLPLTLLRCATAARTLLGARQRRPFDDRLDLIRRVMMQGVFEIGIGMAMRDETGDVIAPAQSRLGQIIDGHLEMASRRIDAAKHQLIAQHQPAHFFRC